MKKISYGIKVIMVKSKIYFLRRKLNRLGFEAVNKGEMLNSKEILELKNKIARLGAKINEC